MKRTHFFHGILLIVLILSFMACKDDHGPIYLVSATDHQQITDDQLEISPFSKGEKFLIRGGDGNYTIKNEKKDRRQEKNCRKDRIHATYLCTRAREYTKNR